MTMTSESHWTEVSLASLVILTDTVLATIWRIEVGEEVPEEILRCRNTSEVAAENDNIMHFDIRALLPCTCPISILLLTWIPTSYISSKSLGVSSKPAKAKLKTVSIQQRRRRYPVIYD